MTLRRAATIFAALLLAAVPPANAQDSEADAPAWRGQMQCVVKWTDPAEKEREWTFWVESDTTNMKLGITAPVRPGDPPPLAKGESRELMPRKAHLEISGLGDGETEATSYPSGDGRMWHDIALGHVEKLDQLPDRFTMTLTIEGTAPLTIEMRDFAAARTYLKRCRDPAGSRL
jgi:hypothetical protein